jgi:glutathione peroxidase
MKRKIILSAMASLLAGGAFLMNGNSQAADMPTSRPTTQPVASVPPVLRFKMKSLVGNKEVDLASYQGKVIMFVNTASFCGNTPEYTGLENLHAKYAAKGLAVLGFPTSDFGTHDGEPGQEFGSNLEIADFCAKTYDVKFDMFSKVEVKGSNMCDLYKFLTSKETDPNFGGPITWNFDKFLVARDGTIVNRFPNKMDPEDPKIIADVEAQLAK